jgi:hypothetical protein
MERRLAVLLAAPFMAQADATIANVATPSITPTCTPPVRSSSS